MNYKDGSAASVGDKVKLRNGELATVVLVAGSEKEDHEFPQVDWPDVQDGVLVKTDGGALVRFYRCHSDELTKVSQPTSAN